MYYVYVELHSVSVANCTEQIKTYNHQLQVKKQHAEHYNPEIKKMLKRKKKIELK